MEKINKTLRELDNQLNRVEPFIWGRIVPENLRSEILGLTINELKERFPDDYRRYFSFLKTEAKILHFPDLELEGAAEKPNLNLLKTGARGYAFKIDLPNESHVIKPLESLAEKDIARKASDLGIGPKQYKTNEGFLHEEFINGTPLLGLEKEKCTKEYMESLGQKFAQALKKLNENNILVNDQILTDDFGKSHMIIDDKGEVRFIDFGASIDMSDFPNISDEAVMSLIRTDPFMAFRMHGIFDNSEEEKKYIIEGYRTNILSQIKTKKELIQMKDGQLLNEGLFLLQSRLPNVNYFIKGIQKEQF